MSIARSGGILIAYKRCYSIYIKVKRISYEVVHWVLLNNDMLNSTRNGAIGTLYIPLASSRYARADIFNDLENDLVNMDLDDFDIKLRGDFNVHLGNEKDLLDFENLAGYLKDMEEEFANYLDTKRAMETLCIKL